MKIKVNDQVKILSGKDRGKTGKVIQVFPVENKVVVEGLNIMKKHLKARKAGEKGQLIELAAPMAIGKAQLICPKCGRAIRVGYKLSGGEKHRVCRKCNEVIE